MKIELENIKLLVSETLKVFNKINVLEIQCLKFKNNLLLDFDILQIIFKVEEECFCSFVSNNDIIPRVFPIEDYSFWNGFKNIDIDKFELKLEEVSNEKNKTSDMIFSSIKINKDKEEDIRYIFINTENQIDKLLEIRI